MNIPDFDTLDEAKAFLRDNWDKGTNCPCCGQRVQRYNYKLFASSAFALIRLYRLGEGEHHIKQFAEATANTPRAPHFAELRFWHMVEASTNDDPTKKASGYWKITDAGKQFVEGTLRVKSRILMYNNKFVGFAPNSEIISIREALGNKFDYEELMA